MKFFWTPVIFICHKKKVNVISVFVISGSIISPSRLEFLWDIIRTEAFFLFLCSIWLPNQYSDESAAFQPPQNAPVDVVALVFNLLRFSPTFCSFLEKWGFKSEKCREESCLKWNCTYNSMSAERTYPRKELHGLSFNFSFVFCDFCEEDRF